MLSDEDEDEDAGVAAAAYPRSGGAAEVRDVYDAARLVVRLLRGTSNEMVCS